MRIAEAARFHQRQGVFRRVALLVLPLAVRISQSREGCPMRFQLDRLQGITVAQKTKNV